MKINSKFKLYIYCLSILLALSASLEFFSFIKIKEKGHEGFSAERVADDIRYISKQPHSIEHPKERELVRNYLFHRLEQMGGRTEVFAYDSIACKFGGCFDIANVYSRFDPDSVTPGTQYLLLVAHMDSRFFNVVLEDTVYSYGAADDGYGLGVILETVSVALKYRHEWKQGIKVLFTDAEEHELDGMRNAWEYDRHLFDHVNFVINVEARGVKGKALLFETSPGNEKLMRLYKQASMPRGFSLTTVVYKAMPNDTDFSLVKDSIPGMNFAVIDNLRYYHTDLDNFSNISRESLQHYGMQLEPVVKEYLTSAVYSTPQSLRSAEDTVFFSLPLLGMFGFSRYQYLAFNISVCLLLAFVILLYVQLGGISFSRILKCALYTGAFMAFALVIGEGIAYAAAKLTGQEFNMVALKYVKYDHAIVAILFMLCLIAVILFFRRMSGKYKYFAVEFLLGALLLAGLLAMVMFIAFTENFFLLLPVFITSAALLVGLVKWGKWIFLLSAILDTIVLGYFIYLLYIALTIGSLGILLLLWSFYIIVLLTQYYCYRGKRF